MRYRGKITNWDDAKGYGFVAPYGGGSRAFVHIKAFVQRGRRPVDGRIITYKIQQDPRGRAQAVDIRYAGARNVRFQKMDKSYTSYIVAAIFVSAVWALAFFGRIPFGVLLVYLVVSALAFLVYAIDKSAARRGRWRTKENTMHLLGVVGGWPGALVAQALFRHKSSKRSFQSVFWFTVLLNIGALIWLITDQGSTFLRELIDFLRS